MSMRYERTEKNGMSVRYERADIQKSEYVV